ncbi:metal-dependent hydrolase [Vreelandella massiliensis]|uniref:metal-dependent hydrolase n=1 Tax=Vreelandella massiliensis TaxID=1816686 RepID=UPI00096A58E6|nr:metal-dependent hydrolase [Halomonas massiliensis]
MAMFGTHLGAAVVGGTVLANAGYAAHIWRASEMLPVIALVIIGGLLPDIDAKKSHSVKLIFSVLGLMAMVAMSFSLREDMALLPALLASIGAYVAVRHGFFHAFNAITVHRGNAHSLVALLFSSTATTVLTHSLTGASILSWSYGFALLAGGLIHLVLDEIYSVDLAGARLKKSFGSALKFMDKNSPVPGLAMLLASLVMLPAMPPLRDGVTILAAFVDAFSRIG